MSATAPVFLVTESDPPAKRALLAAALRLFAQRGIDSVSIRDIAADAGFTNPALFRHFTGKDALAQALFEACYRRLAGALLAPHGGASLHDRFIACLELVEQSPESIHFVLDNLARCWRNLPADARQASVLGTMRRIVAADQAAGRVVADVEPALVAALVLGCLAQVARMAQFDELPRPPTALAADLWRLIDRGTGA